MAVAKKKKKAPARKRRESAPQEHASPLSLNPPPDSGGGKLKLGIALGFIAVIVLIGLQMVLTMRHQASLKFSAIHVGRTIPQGLDDGQARSPLALQGDKDDNLFFLEGMGDNQARLQKFDKGGNFLDIYKPKKVDELIDKDCDMDVDANGEPWVLLKDGEVKILSPDLKFLKSMQLTVNGPTALGLMPDGRVLVSSGQDNKVCIFDQTGKKLGEFGATGTNTGDLANPVRMRVCVDGTIAIMELTPNGLHTKVFGPDLKLRTQFDIKNVQWCEPLRMGVTIDDMMTLNDQLTNRGLLVWNLKTGDFYGESQGCIDNTLWNEPGSSGANKYTKSIYVHSAPGLIHCYLPEAGSK